MSYAPNGCSLALYSPLYPANVKYVNLWQAQQMSASKTRLEIRKRFPSEFDDGFVVGGRAPIAGERERGNYPKGFHDWALDRRNAWFAGFNAGYHRGADADERRTR
jgi:hypothetical protein